LAEAVSGSVGLPSRLAWLIDRFLQVVCQGFSLDDDLGRRADEESADRELPGRIDAGEGGDLHEVRF
jgi:hypothetical protein